MSLARNVFVQTAFTLGSRVLGFARDLALNYRFGGQGPMMDAWGTAQMLPNFFRRLFAEGAFAQSFVPSYARAREVDGPDAAQRMASEVAAFILVVVVGLTILIEVAMPWIVPALLQAYADDTDTLRTATLMAQLAMPYLVCMTLASLLSGVLNTLGRFALTAGAPILLNLCTIGPPLLIADTHLAANVTSAMVTVAGALQALLLWWGVERMGVRIRPGLPRLNPQVKSVVMLAVPGAIAGGAVQLNTLVTQYLSGSDKGARAVLYNAERLYQLPLGLIGVAVGIALVPRLTRFFTESDRGGSDKTMDDGLGLAMAFTLPAALALLVMPVFIIDATMTRGAFTGEDALRTGEVLRAFAWGVPAFVLAKVFAPAYFARRRTREPMQFALVTVAVNIVLGATLWHVLPGQGIDGAIGLGLATSIASWINVFLLAGRLAADNVYRVGPAAWARLARLGAACAVMGAFIAVCNWRYDDLKVLLWSKEIAVLAVGAAGFAIYAVSALVFRAVSVSEIRGALRRERGAPGVESGPGLE
jgi:putative peptidoglycan lipid II flippase